MVTSLLLAFFKADSIPSKFSFENNIRNLINNPKLSKKYAGLSLALGGFYLTPEDLINLYLEFSLYYLKSFPSPAYLCLDFLCLLFLQNFY